MHIVVEDKDEEGNPRAKSYEVSIDDYINQSKSSLISNSSSIEEKDIIDSTHLKRVQAAYTGTIARLKRYMDVTGRTDSSKGTILMWKEQKEWILGYVNTFGDVAEAYVNALYQEHGEKLDYLCKQRIGIGASPYYGHGLIGKFFDKYIAEVDAAGVVAGEDVVTKDKQIGVKNIRGSKWGLYQYKKLAENVLKIKAEIDPKDFPWEYNELLSDAMKFRPYRNARIYKINADQKWSFIGKHLTENMETALKELVPKVSLTNSKKFDII